MTSESKAPMPDASPSRDEVERLIADCERYAPAGYVDFAGVSTRVGHHRATAAMLRKLSAERDAARAEAGRLLNGIEKALLEIEDAGPKALKYAAQELRAALATPETPA